MPFHIGREERDRWLVHMTAAVDATTAGLDPARRRRGPRCPARVLQPGRRAHAQRHRPARSLRTVRLAGRGLAPRHAGSMQHPLTGLDQALRLAEGRRRPVVRDRRGRGVRPARRERGRQVDHGRDPRGPPSRGRPARSRCSVTTLAGRTGLPRPHRHRAADVGGRARADGARGGRDLRLLLPHPPPGRGGRRARRADAAARPARRARCRAVSAAGSTWPWGSSAHPTCCSSTSRRPGSIPPPAARRGSSSAQLVPGGTTVLLTTHYLDEAEHLADRVGVMVAGRLVAEGTPEDADRAAPVRPACASSCRRGRRPPSSIGS